MTARGTMSRTVLAFPMVLLLFCLPAAAALRTNEHAPHFSLPTLEGRGFDLNEALGQGRRKASGGVVLSFFATWCGPCRNELSILNAIAGEMRDSGVTVAAVNVKEDLRAIRIFIAGLKADKLTVLIDRDGTTAALYQVRVLPTTFCIGADGTIKDMLYGEVRDADEFRKCTEKLLH